MKANFDACLAKTLSHEGGWADDPRDAGGATMKGITIGTYRGWKGRAVTKAELRAISDAEVAAIYRQNYWNAVRGDELPAGLDMVAFDAAVNSGVSRGAKWLQTAVGAAADGMIGPATIKAANMAHAQTAIDKACDARLAFLKVSKNTKTGALLWPTYGKGWSRRVADVRDTAQLMTVARPVPKPAAPQPTAGSSLPIPAILIGGAIIAAFVFFM